MIEYDFPDGDVRVLKEICTHTRFLDNVTAEKLFTRNCAEMNEKNTFNQTTCIYRYASAEIRVEASSFFLYVFLTTDWLKKVARVFLTNHKLYELNLTKSKPEFEMNLGPSIDNCSAYFLLVYLLDLFSLFKDKKT